MYWEKIDDVIYGCPLSRHHTYEICYVLSGWRLVFVQYSVCALPQLRVSNEDLGVLM